MQHNDSIIGGNRACSPFLAAMLLLFCVAGCSRGPDNPSFPVSEQRAEAVLAEMSEQREPLPRPVVVLDGYLSPGLGTRYLGEKIARYVPTQQVGAVSFVGVDSFDEARQRVVQAVQSRYPSDDPEATVPVDVIGISMGGLVGRYAAIPRNGERRLNVRRLFTIATPHQGARMAWLPTRNLLQVNMREGSAWIQQLEAAYDRADYELIPYVRLGDWLIDSANAAPEGESPYWVPNRFLQSAHIGAVTDDRIFADILRRLRGEPPLTRQPRAPLPRQAAAD